LNGRRREIDTDLEVVLGTSVLGVSSNGSAESLSLSEKLSSRGGSGSEEVRGDGVESEDLSGL